MPRPLRLASIALVATLAACSDGAPSPTPAASPQPSPPPGAAFLLSLTTSQALPPGSTFGLMPALTVTPDRLVLQVGPVDAMFPGPAVMPVLASKLSSAGWDRVIEAARTYGLLDRADGDFTGGGILPGGVTGQIRILVDGELRTLTGDPTRVVRCGQTRCVPTPGTPEAFGAFWAQLTGDLAGWLGAELGPTGAWAPVAYAVLVGDAPGQDPNLPQPILPWPLPVPAATFGAATTSPAGGRCGAVTGDDAARLGNALAQANQLTRWRDPSGALLGITVRPMLPGDTVPCPGMLAD